MQPHLIFIIMFLVVFALTTMGMIVWTLKWYRRVEQGKALVITKRQRVDVSFTGNVVIPILWTAEEIDIRMHQIDIEKTGDEAVISKDGQAFDVKATFYVKINQTQEDILNVAQTCGFENAGDADYVRSFFTPKFEHAIGEVAAGLTADELHRQREHVIENICQTIGFDLNGFVLEDVALHDLRKTPQ